MKRLYSRTKTKPREMEGRVDKDEVDKDEVDEDGDVEDSWRSLGNSG